VSKNDIGQHKSLASPGRAPVQICAMLPKTSNLTSEHAHPDWWMACGYKKVSTKSYN